MQSSAQLSVEEILESIKRVIARDNSEVAQAERHRRETVGVVFSDAPILTEVEEAPADEDGSGGFNIEVLELAELVEEAPEAPPEPPEPSEPQAAPASEGQTQVRESLAALAALSGAPHAPQADEGEAPLERMVRETLRPMLADWLDAHLPAIVERLVKVEIERISGKPR